MKIILQTERLLLREVQEDDFDLMHHLDVDPVVKKYLGPALAEEEISIRFEKCFERYKEGRGLGKWVAQEKSTGHSIGWFVLTNLDGTEEIEIGYRLKEKFWGIGYATEMSKALLEYGFNERNLDSIVGVSNPENEASKKVLEKIGLKYVGIKYYYKQNVCYFELSNQDYRKSKS